MIKGFRYQNNEHKDTGYADDVSITFTDTNSINEISNVLNKFEKATNAKINVDKTDGLWLGKWKPRPDKPMDINWGNSMVKNLGVYIGNNRLCAEKRGFEEAKEKIKCKISYWSGKGISLKGKIRILNMFILPKLWYICEIQDIPVNIKLEINRFILAFIWNGKHQQRSIKGLEADYCEGGFKLDNIDKKIKCLRVKWIAYLSNLDNNHFEFYLANEIISLDFASLGFNILKGYSDKYVSAIKNNFYKNAILAWLNMKIIYSPKNILSIKKMWIYENILLQDDDGRVYKPPSHSGFRRQRRDMPYVFEQLPYLVVNRHYADATFIRSLNNSFANIQWANNDTFYLEQNGERKDIKNLSFKELYWSLTNADLPQQPFIRRWSVILPSHNFDWSVIWKNVHSNILSYKTQSSLWMMTNLNFISSYSLNRMYNTPNTCCQCSQAEEGYAHCFLFCSVSTLVYRHFDGLLQQILPVNLSLEEKAFGVVVNNPQVKRKILHNYILACIKCVIFRNRARKWNCNIITKSDILIKKCKIYISYDLNIKFINFKHKNHMDKFTETFLIDNVLGTIQANDTSLFVNL